MEKDIEKIMHILREVQMTENEKSTMRTALLSKIQTQESVPSTYSQTWWHLFVHSQRTYALALCLFILVGSGSVIFGAQGSLPGDVLYPIKTEISEPVLRALSKSSPINSAQFEISIMETRLSEAQQLADKGNLQPRKKLEIAHNVAQQTKRVEDAVNELPSQEATSVQVSSNTTFQSSDVMVMTADTQQTPPKREEDIATPASAQAFTKMSSSEGDTRMAPASTTQATTSDKNISNRKRDRRDIIEKVDGLLKKYRPTIQLLEESERKRSDE